MSHVVLLGDSIFDNARYVPGRPAVVEQLRQCLPAGWQASLLAVDDHVTRDVAGQLAGLPPQASHLFISAGGNDALRESGILDQAVRSVAESLELVGTVRARFAEDYRRMLVSALQFDKPTAVCTVYDAIPGLGPAAQTAIGLFNEVILREAFALALPVIDLRLVCDKPEDFSSISPIEPSFHGGAKIARLIAEVATQHDFTPRRSVVYA